MVARGTPRARPGRWWSGIRVDLVAFVVIAMALVAIELPFLHHGISFNDSAWYYHFGRRALAGDVPYRDYVFQVGPLPIYVDAAFQRMFGSSYLASMYAALFIRILRVGVAWMLARRLAGARCAALFATFCALDQVVGWAHHWSWCYAELFVLLSGLCFVLAARAERERRALGFLALAGMTSALVVSARQATAVMLGVVLVATTVMLALRKEYFTRRRLLALGGGFALGLLVVFGALAALGALGPAIQQLFLDAPQK